jgi:hypothetical protein
MYNVEFIDSLKKKYDNVNFLNFNEEREGYNLNGKCFFDSSHLTYLGSYQVTHRLVDSLSQWYNIPKKEGNQVNYKYLNLLNYSYNLIDDQDKFIKLEFDSIPALIKDHKLAVYLYPKDSTLLSEYSKEKNFKSDSFYIDLDDSSSIKLGESVVFIDRLKTNITEKTLDRIKVFFYKPNDTLKLQSFTIKPDDLKNQ